jgi:hypothetical protein
MTEAEWLRSTDPTRMLTFLRDGGLASERKYRLFACASIRRIWNSLTDERSRTAVEVAERFADGFKQELELERAQWAAEKALRQPLLQADVYSYDVAVAAYEAAMPPVQGTAYAANVAFWVANAIFVLSPAWDAPRAIRRERDVQSHLLRDIFGSPFHRVANNPDWSSWSSGTVPKLAQHIYDGRRLPDGTLEADQIAVLADALEEAGCTDSEMLNHGRGPGPHVRGCWVVDLILGKS